jgi:hypothetical protein
VLLYFCCQVDSRQQVADNKDSTDYLQKDESIEENQQDSTSVSIPGIDNYNIAAVYRRV